MHGHGQRRGFGRPPFGRRWYSLGNVVERLENYQREEVTHDPSQLPDIETYSEDWVEGGTITEDDLSPEEIASY